MVKTGKQNTEGRSVTSPKKDSKNTKETAGKQKAEEKQLAKTDGLAIFSSAMGILRQSGVEVSYAVDPNDSKRLAIILYGVEYDNFTGELKFL